ncbi:hypothetical protein BJV78DRAFT_1253782 [Lactifluus subvellereus]|nr:hypothetical protein BJV78DRAFT_1253782 [Lactifluus subvellereus]
MSALSLSRRKSPSAAALLHTFGKTLFVSPLHIHLQRAALSLRVLPRRCLYSHYTQCLLSSLCQWPAHPIVLACRLAEMACMVCAPAHAIPLICHP